MMQDLQNQLTVTGKQNFQAAIRYFYDNTGVTMIFISRALFLVTDPDYWNNHTYEELTIEQTEKVYDYIMEHKDDISNNINKNQKKEEDSNG